MKRPKRHVLPAAALASIAPSDVAAFVESVGWSADAARWLAHEAPVDLAILYIAIGERRAPREVLEQILDRKRAEELRREAETPSPKPPNTKRSRRG